MNAKIDNDLKVFELLLRNNEYYNYSVDEINFNIEAKDYKQVYAIRKEHIKRIDFIAHTVDQLRVQIILNHGSYLYVNLSKNYISVGL